jgi:hypothetical protein
MVISSSSEEEAHDVNSVQQDDQAEAPVENEEQNTCLWSKELLLVGEAQINSCPNHVYHLACVR